MTKKEEELQTFVWDLSTGDQSLRPLTDLEIEDMNKSLLEIQSEKKELEKKAQSRVSALAKLIALGLTEEEIASL
jgi:DNA-binding NarL/FixJ family response regulator